MIMIIEQEIEKRIVEAIGRALDGNGIHGIQVTGSLQTGLIKAVEDGECSGLIVVKVKPRSYQTPTTPECQIPVSVVFTSRADVDYDGKSYIGVSGVLLDIFTQWQRCLDDVHSLFGIESRFDCTGYQLADGDTTVDPSGKTWGYTHDMSIYGVIGNIQTN